MPTTNQVSRAQQALKPHSWEISGLPSRIDLRINASLRSSAKYRVAEAMVLKLALWGMSALAMSVKCCAQHVMVHAERNVRNPGGSNPDHDPAVDVVLDREWTFNRGQKRPAPLCKSVMEKRLDQLVGTVTGYASFNRLLERLKADRDEPLRFSRPSGDTTPHTSYRMIFESTSRVGSSCSEPGARPGVLHDT